MAKINLQFGPSDSIYKIFKILEKLPVEKQITLNIDSKNNIYQNSWWGKQLVNYLETKRIDYTFLTYSTKTYEYFSSLTDKVINKENKVANFGEFLLQKLKIFQGFHKRFLTKKNLSTYLLIAIEIAILFAAFKFFYDLISPSASVLITPNYDKQPFAYNFEFYDSNNTGAQSSHIGIGYKYINFTKTFSLSYPLVSAKENSINSRGKAILYNTLPEAYSLKAGTKISTSDGLQFVLPSATSIDSGTDLAPYMMIVDLVAASNDLAGSPMGQRGNISSGTKLFVTNLPESSQQKKLYLLASENFSGGFYEKVGKITQEDIDAFKNYANIQISQNSGSYINEYLSNQNNKNLIALPFSDLIKFSTGNYDISSKIGSSASEVKGLISVQIQIPVISIQEFDQKAQQFVSPRISQNKKFVKILSDSINFYYEDKKNLEKNILIVPTKFDAQIGYDFEKDQDGYILELKQKLKGLNIAQAKEVLGRYESIANSSITLSPPWYDSLPNIKSRINIIINNQNL